MEDEQRQKQSRELWDGEAADFDSQPDHGLRDPVVRSAWTNCLAGWLPASPSTILDIGCGTGSLSVVMAALGHEVIGIDLSPAMIAQAEAKATACGRQIEFRVMEASAPQFSPQQFEVIVSRHLLWALPEPAQALQRWTNLLTPGGRLVLIEGHWHTGAGLHSHEVVAVLPTSFIHVSVQNLSSQPELWGGEITDERYAVTADLPVNNGV